MRRRSGIGDGYRYGYQGSERDNQVKGQGFDFNAQIGALKYQRGGDAYNGSANSFQWFGENYTTNGGMINPYNKNPLKIITDDDVEIGSSYQWNNTWVIGD